MPSISIEERAGHPDGPVPDPLEPILARIKSHFQLSPTDLLRIHRTATLLTSRGVALDDESAMAAWLAPVVCRSPAEQQDLYEMFGPPRPLETKRPSGT